jgi:putative tryptophan/tyrosine transport system substrate-binding protein
MKRRDLIKLFGGAAVVWPLAARAHGRSMQRIGLLSGGAAGDPEIAAFNAALAEFGWIEGRNIQIDYRFAAANVERLLKVAKPVVGRVVQPEGGSPYVVEVAN